MFMATERNTHHHLQSHMLQSTYSEVFKLNQCLYNGLASSKIIFQILWHNGSASDSRAEGCVFKSRQGQTFAKRLLNNQTFLPILRMAAFIFFYLAFHYHNNLVCQVILGPPDRNHLRGPALACLTPDQKVTCSNHVRVSSLLI